MNFKLSTLKVTCFALLTASALLIPGGCNGEDSSYDTGEGGKPTIAISIPSADHGWTGGVVYWANKAKADFGDKVNIQVVTAAGPEEQVRQIEDLMTRGVAGLVVLAHNSGPLTPIAEKAKKRGIYLVSVDRGFDKPVADLYVAGDNAAMGRESAKYIVEKMKADGDTNLIILTGLTGNVVNATRVDAAKQVFSQHPEIKILDEQPGDWSRDKAMTTMQALLQKHAEIDVVWCQDDDMAEGVEQAIKEAGRTGIWVFGGAGKKEIVKRIMDGDEMFPATITYPPGMIYGGVAVAVAHLVDGDIAAAADYMPSHLGVTKDQLEQAKKAEGQKQITLGVVLITPDNASEYYFPDSAY